MLSGPHHRPFECAEETLSLHVLVHLPTYALVVGSRKREVSRRQIPQETLRVN